MYRPLPKSLTIKPSEIEGLGLFAVEEIPAYEVIGMTHVKWYGEPNDLLRTPLGGFINHNEKPNCEIQGKLTRYLYTLVDIQVGTELTVKYKMYNLEEE